MGTSRPFVLSDICNRIIEIKPKTVIDIGIGFGKYGFLTREYSDIWNHNVNKTHITGIDVFKPTTELPHLKHIYDKIICANIVDIIDDIQPVDVVFFCDVIEHLKFEDGIKILNKLKESNHVFVSTPLNPGSRGAMDGNKHEAHISKWSIAQLSNYGSVKLYNNHTILLEMMNA